MSVANIDVIRAKCKHPNVVPNILVMLVNDLSIFPNSLSMLIGY